MIINWKKYGAILISMFLLSFYGCQDDYDNGSKEGKLVLNISLKGKTEEITSKSGKNPEDNCEIKISNKEGDIYI